MASERPAIGVRTRIIATIGPASAQPAVLDSMLAAGLDACRINFSHGDADSHARTAALVRDAAARRAQTVTLLGDLCGPKIRLGAFEAPALIAAGATVRFVRGDATCTAERLTTSFPALIDAAHAGQRILIDDGLIRLLVVEKRADELVCTCVAGGTLSSRKGVNLPDTRLDIPALTDKDRRDLDWAIDHDLDYVALSFVRSPADVRELRGALAARRSPMRVIVKIERTEALEHLDEIVDLADGVLVARGDLGVEMDVWQVPLVQKALTARCRAAAKPVIIATQMLQSMIASPMPTRAEVSDVANAIFDGADAVMLSGETATGAYPAVAVDIMNRIAVVSEAYLAEQAHAGNSPADQAVGPQSGRDAAGESIQGQHDVPTAVARAAAQAALRLGARLVAVRTATGNAARLIASHRLPMPVVGLTWDERVARQINLLYGVIPLPLDPITEPVELFARLDPLLLARGLVSSGDRIVMVSATHAARPHGTNALMIHTVRA